MAGSAWAQEKQQVDWEFYKQIPKNAHFCGTLRETLSTGNIYSVLDEQGNRTGFYMRFTIVITQAVLSGYNKYYGAYGRVLVEDGALAYGEVVESQSFVQDKDEVSRLVLTLTHVQKRDGELARIYTKDLVFVEKRLSKKAVWLKSLRRAGIYSLLTGFFINPILPAVYGFGSGKGEYGHIRDSFQPKDIVLEEGRVLCFEVKNFK